MNPISIIGKWWTELPSPPFSRSLRSIQSVSRSSRTTEMLTVCGFVEVKFDAFFFCSLLFRSNALESKGGMSTSPSPPPVAGPSKPTSSHFHTLDRENAFSHPSALGPKYEATQALIAPHINSFDALFEGAPTGTKGEVSPSQGLLDLAVADVSPKVIFDGNGKPGELGNRLESASYLFVRSKRD